MLTSEECAVSSIVDQYAESSFEKINLINIIRTICELRLWYKPTIIQAKAIPKIILGLDVIGLSETGSGKTGAFLLPILQKWIECEYPKNFALILLPTRELAKQIFSEVEFFSDLLLQTFPDSQKLESICLIGGEDMVSQTLQLSWYKHSIIIATPGRLCDHIDHDSSFIKTHLANVKHLVLDEADQMLNLQFQDSINRILGYFDRPLSKTMIKEQRYRKKLSESNFPSFKIPHPQTYLFSATITKDVQKLRRAALRYDAAFVSSSSHDSVGLPKTLSQFYITVQLLDRPIVLDWIISEKFTNLKSKEKIIVFCNRIKEVVLINEFLNARGFLSVKLSGKTDQKLRSEAASQFSSGAVKILVATDVAARGLDFANVILVINYEVPSSEKTYRHRVGRTARSCANGESITFVTRDSAQSFLELEGSLSKWSPEGDNWRMPKWPGISKLGEKNFMAQRRLLIEIPWQEANKNIREAIKKKLHERFKNDSEEDNFSDNSSVSFSSSLTNEDSKSGEDDSKLQISDFNSGLEGVKQAKVSYRRMAKERKLRRLEKEKSVKHKVADSCDLIEEQMHTDSDHLRYDHTLSERNARKRQLKLRKRK